jgi:hypothetical protein
MAKGRMLQNRISKSNKLASLSSDTVRLLYTWILSHLDCNGSFYADPVMVNNLVFTRLGHSVKTVANALDELESVGLIVRYKADGETYLNYPDFFDKQPKLHPEREGSSDIPKITHELIQSNAHSDLPNIRIREEEDKKKNKSNAQKRGDDEFEIFWKKYPRKVNRKEALSAFKKAQFDSFEIIIEAIEKQKHSEQWIRDGGKYIPYPSSWLNKERWKDEGIDQHPLAGKVSDKTIRNIETFNTWRPPV